jgi:hypothetical protein
MVRKRTKPASHRVAWSKQDLRILRSGPRQKRSQSEIAAMLGRTLSAIQQKAFSGRVAFRRKKV